jgi:hypothetical protein
MKNASGEMVGLVLSDEQGRGRNSGEKELARF